MTHEKIFKRENGSYVKIIASVSSVHQSSISYRIVIQYKEPRKRTWFMAVDFDQFSFRRLDTLSRIDHIKAKNAEYASDEEILQTKLELWEKMKPTE